MPTTATRDGHPEGPQPVPLIEARDGSFSYTPDRPVFEHVSFTLGAGEILTILGPNGAGKSTLLDCLAGLAQRPMPWVLVNGQHSTRLSNRERAQVIGYVPQMQQVNFDFSVRDYLVMGRSARLGLLDRPGASDFEAVERALDELGIGDLADKSMQQMSGGERQQVQIARVLVQDPSVILLDEPTNHLDFGNQAKVLQAIENLAHSRNLAVIMTTHMPDHAIVLGGRVAILDRNGRLSVGPVDQAMDERLLGDIYRTKVRIVHVDQIGRDACFAVRD